MKFCSECSAAVSLLIPSDDNRERHVCLECGTIHYQNPKLVVGSIPVWEEAGEFKVLLCKRAIEPRHGYWTLPAGFMENQESSSQAAIRETTEEAGAEIELHQLFSVMNVPQYNQVHLFYRASLLNLNYVAGIESLEVQLFSEAEIPWDQIAFSTVRITLKCLFEDRAKAITPNQSSQQPPAIYGLHTHDIMSDKH